MKSILLVLPLLLIFRFPAVCFADGMTISQSIDKSQIAYEDSALFEIVLQWPGPQTAYFFDKPLQPSMDRLQVRGFSSTISSSIKQGQESTTKTYRYVLIPTSSGTGKIDPVTISYVTWPDSTPGQLVTELMSITIGARILPEQTKPISPYLWIAVVVGFSLSVLVVAYVVHRRQPKEAIASMLTPREQFLSDLQGVKGEAGQELKKFQTGLYKILSRYLESAYGLRVGNLAEADLRGSLKDTVLSNDQIETVVGWLMRAQRDKFSPVNAAPGAVIRLESEVREFFEKL